MAEACEANADGLCVLEDNGNGWYCTVTDDTDGYITVIDCTVMCGDGFIKGFEDCEDGGNPPENHDGCNTECVYEDGWYFDQSPWYTMCGDGFVVGDEECDPGLDGDWINETCEVHECTLLTMDDGWTCETEFDTLGLGYVTGVNCEAYCGDEKVLGAEQCD